MCLVKYAHPLLSVTAKFDESEVRRDALPSEPSTVPCGHVLRSHVLWRASAVEWHSLSVLEDAASLQTASAAAHTKAAAHAPADLERWHDRGENACSSRSAGLVLRGKL